MAKCVFSPAPRTTYATSGGPLSLTTSVLPIHFYAGLPKGRIGGRASPHGASRPEISPTARILIGRYIIIYDPMPYGIFVVAVVYGPRDVENWLN